MGTLHGRSQPDMQRFGNAKTMRIRGRLEEEQAKKSPLGSGLNLFLEENRGDMVMMLQRTRSVQ